jgi:hypothetical protein
MTSVPTWGICPALGCRFAEERSGPNRTVGKSMAKQGFLLHLGTVARLHRQPITTIHDNDGINEMLMKMVHVFNDAIV